jgi:hypothetical protein
MPETNVEFKIESGAVRLVTVIKGAGRKTRGQKLVERLRGRGDLAMRGPPAEY